MTEGWWLPYALLFGAFTWAKVACIAWGMM